MFSSTELESTTWRSQVNKITKYPLHSYRETTTMGDSDNDTRNTVRTVDDTVNQTARSVERTCTQKLTIPILEKHDTTSVRLWWRRFTQYVKMTKDIDLTEMTASREIRHE